MGFIDLHRIEMDKLNHKLYMYVLDIFLTWFDFCKCLETKKKKKSHNPLHVKYMAKTCTHDHDMDMFEGSLSAEISLDITNHQWRIPRGKSISLFGDAQIS